MIKVTKIVLEYQKISQTIRKIKMKQITVQRVLSQIPVGRKMITEVHVLQINLRYF
jgi:hypothetical protein